MGKDFFNKTNNDLFWDVNDISKDLIPIFKNNLSLNTEITKEITEKYGEWINNFESPRNPIELKII